MKKGFTVVEVLISMMILFIAITFVNISIRSFNIYQLKSEKYQDFYITALSLKDWLSLQISIEDKYEGEMNDIKYNLKIQLVSSKKNWSHSFLNGSGNNGKYLIKLYKVEMKLNRDNKESIFEFFLTKQLSLKLEKTLIRKL